MTEPRNIEDQVAAELASRRLHPDDGYAYEECAGPACRAIREAAAAPAPAEEAAFLRGWDGGYALAMKRAATGDSVGPLDERLREAFVAGFAYGRGAAGLDAELATEVGREYAKDYVEVWGSACTCAPTIEAATGDSGGPLERCPWCDGTGRVVEDASLPYDKADHAAREGVPDWDL